MLAAATRAKTVREVQLPGSKETIDTVFFVSRVESWHDPVLDRLIEDVRLRGLTVAEAAANHGYTLTAAKVSIHRSMKSLNARFAPASTDGAEDED